MTAKIWEVVLSWVKGWGRLSLVGANRFDARLACSSDYIIKNVYAVQKREGKPTESIFAKGREIERRWVDENKSVEWYIDQLTELLDGQETK